MLLCSWNQSFWSLRQWPEIGGFPSRYLKWWMKCSGLTPIAPATNISHPRWTEMTTVYRLIVCQSKRQTAASHKLGNTKGQTEAEETPPPVCLVPGWQKLNYQEACVLCTVCWPGRISILEFWQKSQFFLLQKYLRW